METLTKKLPRADRYSGNLMAEAWALYDAGYCTGAVVTARVSLEKTLMRISGKPSGSPDRRGLAREARQLINSGQLPGIGINALGKLADAMSDVAHGGYVDRRLAKELLGKADKLQHILLTS